MKLTPKRVGKLTGKDLTAQMGNGMMIPREERERVRER